jgi:hypothetical protein
MDHIAKNMKPLHLLKHPLKLTKSPKLLLLDNKRTSPLLGKKQENIKNMLLLLIFQRINSQLTSIGEMLVELILLLNIEIKGIVVLATLFLSLKLLNNV